MTELKTYLLALAFCLAGVCASSGEKANVRLAIIPGQGQKAPKKELLALLEVELSNVKGTSLLERAKVARLLAEQKLSLSGVVDPRKALKLGKIVQADVFVFMERLGPPKSLGRPRVSGRIPSREEIMRLRKLAKAPSAYRVQVVETRTGVTLGADFLLETELIKDIKPLVSLVKAAVAKQRGAGKKRRYIALLSFRSSEPGWLLTGTATAMGEVTITELARSPNVVVLNREHASALLKEKDLSAVELKLKAAAMFLEGSLKRAPGGKEFEVQVTLRPLAGGATRKLSLKVPARDMTAARKKIAGAVLDELKVASLSVAPADPKAEAKAFKRRARLHALHGEVAVAVRAMEVAVALDPSDANRVELIRSYEAYSHWLVGLEYLSGSKKPSPKLIVKAIAARLRALHMKYALVSSHVDAWKRGEKVPLEPPIVPREWPGMSVLSLYLPPKLVEARRVRAQAARVATDCYLKVLDYAEARAKDEGAEKLWKTTLTSLPEPAVWARDVKMWSKSILEAVSRLEKSSIKLDPNKGGESWLITQYTQELHVLRGGLRTPAEVRLFDTTLQQLSKSRSSVGRRVGLLGRLRVSGYKDLKAGRALLDLYATSLPADTREQKEKLRRGHNDALKAYTAQKVLRAIDNSAVTDSFCRRIVDASLKNGDAARINAWRHVIELWLDALEKMNKKDDADQYAKRMLETIKTYTGDASLKMTFLHVPARYLVRLSEKLTARRRRYGTLKPAAQTPGGWSALRVKPFNIGPMPRGFVRLARIAVVGADLIVVWAGEPNKATMTLQISAVPLKGGRPRILGRTQVARGMRIGLSGRRLLEPVTCITGDKTAVYVGTSEGGLVVCKGGRSTVLTEARGLPAKGLLSAVCLGGKVYLGLGNPTPAQRAATGGFAEFDPAKGTFKVLAASRSQAKRSGLDAGNTYKLTSMLADPKRKCVWLGVYVNRRPRDQTGLWKYTPADGKIKHVWTPYYGIKGLCWRNGKIIAYLKAMRPDLIEIDPDSLKKRRLAGRTILPPARDCRGGLVYGEPGRSNLLWPCAFVGGGLVTGGKGLFLHQPGKVQPAPLAQVAGGGELGFIELLDEHSGRVIFATKKGRAYEITFPGK